jgi:nitroreductase
MLRDLVLRTRSVRRFDQSVSIPLATLRELVDIARHTASAGNMQPLRYILSAEEEMNTAIFRHLRWAAYLRNYGGPAEGERPTAYIVVLHDLELTHSIDCDHGIAAQTMLLAATERGLGGCIIGSINKEALASELHLSPRFEIMMVVAFGKPAQSIVLEECREDGNIKYWRDPSGVHHVPKRGLQELILSQYGA